MPKKHPDGWKESPKVIPSLPTVILSTHTISLCLLLTLAVSPATESQTDHPVSASKIDDTIFVLIEAMHAGNVSVWLGMAVVEEWYSSPEIPVDMQARLRVDVELQSGLWWTDIQYVSRRIDDFGGKVLSVHHRTE